MPKYVVTLYTSAFWTTEVEADSPEEAAENAFMQGAPSLCSQEYIELSGEWELDSIEETD